MTKPLSEMTDDERYWVARMTARTDEELAAIRRVLSGYLETAQKNVALEEFHIAVIDAELARRQEKK